MAEGILQRVANGDQEAVQQCIDAYGALVWSLARRYSPSLGDAEDVVQEVFIDLWKSASRYDPAIAGEATFVTMITRRRIIDRRRSASREPARSAADLRELPLMGAEAAPGPAEQNEEAQLAAEALRQLLPEEQQVIRLAVVDGWSHSQIAAHLRIPLGTVKTQVRRGLIRVRELLGASARPDTAEVAS